MRVQVLIAMGQDQLSREEVVNPLYQRVHVVATTQDLRHGTRNFIWLSRDYLGTEGTLFQ